jgi:hypothetical protein
MFPWNKRDNERMGSTKGGQSVVQLSDYKLLMDFRIQTLNLTAAATATATAAQFVWVTSNVSDEQVLSECVEQP